MLRKPAYLEMIDDPIRFRIDDIDRIALAVRYIDPWWVTSHYRTESTRPVGRVDIVRIEQRGHRAFRNRELVSFPGCCGRRTAWIEPLRSLRRLSHGHGLQRRGLASGRQQSQKRNSQGHASQTVPEKTVWTEALISVPACPGRLGDS